MGIPYFASAAQYGMPELFPGRLSHRQDSGSLSHCNYKQSMNLSDFEFLFYPALFTKKSNIQISKRTI